MTFVVSDGCIKCKHTDCVEVCPVDCFYEGPNFLVINPDECIDCALCEPECPVDAIVERLIGRRTCGKCGSVYHVAFNPPSQGEVCDVEGCELTQRPDDTEETVRKRLDALAAPGKAQP